MTHVKLARWPEPWRALSFGRYPIDTGANEIGGLGMLGPTEDLDPFALFQVLVVLEEVPDLLNQNLGEIAIACHALIEGVKLIDRHGDDLLVDALLELLSV